MKINMKRTIYTAGLSAAVAAAALGLGGCGTGTQIPDTIKVQNMDADSNTITVIGKEEVKVVPDMAEIEYSIYTKKETAAECQSENAKDLNAAIEKLKSLGVEEKSIQTSSYGLNPIHDWNSSDQAVTGYEMTTRLTVSDIPIDQAGTILSESVSAGVNGIDSVTYFSSGYDASYQEALKGAMAVARAKADALAEASGRLWGLSPLRKLSQGFGYIEDQEGKRLGSVKQAPPGSGITVQVADGTLSALVTERNEESGWQNWIKTEQT